MATSNPLLNADGPFRIEPLGDRALVIEVGAGVSAAISERARAVAKRLAAASLPAVTDIVPAFRTVAIHYRPVWTDDGVTPSDRLRSQVEAALAGGIAVNHAASRSIEIPVCYGDEFGPDLDDVAARCSLSPDRVVDLHVNSPHVVYMLGFAPGFPYIGALDPRLAVPRRATPRTAVPVGSVAIANDQSVIYSLESPGGWNVIGRTPLTMFMPAENPPCRLQPGDSVRFVSITADRFRALEERS